MLRQDEDDGVGGMSAGCRGWVGLASTNFACSCVSRIIKHPDLVLRAAQLRNKVHLHSAAERKAKECDGSKLTGGWEDSMPYDTKRGNLMLT